MARWEKDRKTKFLICPKCKAKELVNKTCYIRLYHNCDYIPMISEKLIKKQEEEKQKEINQKLFLGKKLEVKNDCIQKL